MQVGSGKHYLVVIALLLSLISAAGAHGHDVHTVTATEGPPTTSTADAVSYFQYGKRSGWMISHIIVMTLSWIFILPIGVVLSLARSPYQGVVQSLFLVCNAAGVALGVFYNSNTPDLYANNAHHKLGWVLTAGVLVQAGIGIVLSYINRKDSPFIPIPRRAMAEHHWHHRTRVEAYRFSHDSGHGTDSNSESRSPSCSDDSCHSPLTQEHEVDAEENQSLMHQKEVDRVLSKILPVEVSAKLVAVLNFIYNAVDRVILLLGFAAICTGWITYGGLFMGDKLFSGLAHWIKGGIFFWIGILTLGRWAGCFADIGWAWNMRPVNTRINQPTAEFVESFLIFLYGATNVFLEHLAAWGKEWSATDLEHISLTFMFFGGGLCGMLIESKRMRDLLDTTHSPAQSQIYFAADKEVLEEPSSYATPMNPIPGLVILLLGIMMSSHHQDSMVSTMIHSQWGSLLVGAAFARGATYILNYLSPPKSIHPGRPPTELITAFCFMAGGFIFMASARDVVETIELHQLDAMFVFTVTMGLITFLMAWVLAVLAIKGWAVKREAKSLTAPTQF